jgi:hypothetical protein
LSISRRYSSMPCVLPLRWLFNAMFLLHISFFIWLAAHWTLSVMHDSSPGAHWRTAAIHLPCTVRVVHAGVEDSSMERVPHTPADHQAAATAGEHHMGFADHARSKGITGLFPEHRSIHLVASWHQEEPRRHSAACWSNIGEPGVGHCWLGRYFVGKLWHREGASCRLRARRSDCGSCFSCGA